MVPTHVSCQKKQVDNKKFALIISYSGIYQSKEMLKIHSCTDSFSGIELVYKQILSGNNKKTQQNLAVKYKMCKVCHLCLPISK